MTEPAAPVDTGALLDGLRARGADTLDPVRFAYLQALARRLPDQPDAVRRALAEKIAAEAAALDACQRQAAVLSPEPPSQPHSQPHSQTPSQTPSQPSSLPAGSAVDASPRSPLSGLLDYLNEVAGPAPESLFAARRGTLAALPASLAKRKSGTQKPKIGAPGAPELKSVAYFRKTWSKLSTEQQLTQTLAQAPENAGPMNSQHLVLRSLQVMREVSPAYLQGFMSYIDALIWLDEVAPVKAAPPRGAMAAPAPAKAKAKRRAKVKTEDGGGKGPPGGSRR